jgi:hypothetical protein
VHTIQRVVNVELSKTKSNSMRNKERVGEKHEETFRRKSLTIFIDSSKEYK